MALTEAQVTKFLGDMDGEFFGSPKKLFSYLSGYG